ncbi:MAG: ATPase domain-containing protein [Methanolobus sp.]
MCSLRGVPPGATILVLAEPGANSEMFAQQFVYGGLLNNEEVFYFTSEHPASEIISEMDNMKWEVDKFLEDESLEFIDAYLPRFYNVLPKEFTSDLSAKDFLKKVQIPWVFLRLLQHRKEMENTGE